MRYLAEMWRQTIDASGRIQAGAAVVTSGTLIVLARLTGALEAIRLEPSTLTPSQLWEQVALYLAYLIIVSFVLYAVVIAPIKMWYVAQKRIDGLQANPPVQHHEHHHTGSIDLVGGEVIGELIQNAVQTTLQDAGLVPAQHAQPTPGGIVTGSVAPEEPQLDLKKQ